MKKAMLLQVDLHPGLRASLESAGLLRAFLQAHRASHRKFQQAFPCTHHGTLCTQDRTWGLLSPHCYSLLGALLLSQQLLPLGVIVGRTTHLHLRSCPPAQAPALDSVNYCALSLRCTATVQTQPSTCSAAARKEKCGKMDLFKVTQIIRVSTAAQDILTFLIRMGRSLSPWAPDAQKHSGGDHRLLFSIQTESMDGSHCHTHLVLRKLGFCRDFSSVSSVLFDLE